MLSKSSDPVCSTDPTDKCNIKEDAPKQIANAQKKSDPICSSDPTDPACPHSSNPPLEKKVVYPIVPTADDIKNGLNKPGVLQDNDGRSVGPGSWQTAAQKTNMMPKQKQNLAVKTDIRLKSDPNYNSDQGYMIGRASEEVEKAIYHDNRNDKLDGDIIDTDKHIKQ